MCTQRNFAINIANKDEVATDNYFIILSFFLERVLADEIIIYFSFDTTKKYNFL